MASINKRHSRVEYWKEYRESINEQSRRIEHPLDNKELNRTIKEINNIDECILQGFKAPTIKTPTLMKVVEQQEHYFEPIICQIKDFNHDTIKKIDIELELANNALTPNYNIDPSTGLVSLESIVSGNTLEELKNIKQDIDEVANIIQFFPQESKKKLEKLSLLIETTKKNNNFAQLHSVQFDEPLIKTNKNKIIYWSFLGALTLAIILTLIFIVLIVTL